VVTVWLSHRDGFVRLSPGEQRAANWYLLCGAYIHFLMDGLVGCYGVWGLMRRAYETLDGRFPHADTGSDAFDSAAAHAGGKAFTAAGLGTPPEALRRAVPNFAVPFVVGHLEMIVYFPACLALYYAYKRGLAWRRPLEILVAAFQLFGAIIFMGSEEVLGSPNLFIAGHVTGLGRVTEPSAVDVACFYWFAYFFCNLIWVFVPIPLIWYATKDIMEGRVATALPWVSPDGSVEDVVDLDAIPEGDEGDDIEEFDDATLRVLGHQHAKLA